VKTVVGIPQINVPETGEEAASNIRKNLLHQAQVYLASDHDLVSLIVGDGFLRYTASEPSDGTVCQFIISVQVDEVERKEETA